MKTSEKWRTSILIIVIILLLGAILGNKPAQVLNNPNQPDDYQAVMFYNPKTGKIFAQGYHSFPNGYHKAGIDSSIYTIDVKNGENYFYFVLYDMSIEFTVTKYSD